MDVEFWDYIASRYYLASLFFFKNCILYIFGDIITYLSWHPTPRNSDLNNLDCRLRIKFSKFPGDPSVHTCLRSSVIVSHSVGMIDQDDSLSDNP